MTERKPAPVPPHSRLDSPWAAPVIIGLGAMAPAAVLLHAGPVPLDSVTVVELVVAAYSGTRLGWFATGRRIYPLQGMFWLFCYIAMGIAPLAQQVAGKTPTPLVVSDTDLRTAEFLVLLGCIAFDVGCLLEYRRRREVPLKAPREVDFDPRTCLALTAAAVLTGGLLVVKLGGLGNFFSSRQAVTAALDAAGITSSGGSQVTSALLRGVGTVTPLVALAVVLGQLIYVRASRTIELVACAIVLVAVNGVVNNPIANPRYWFLTVAVGLLFTAFRSSLFAYRAVLLGGVGAAIFLFPFADKFRYAAGAARPVSSGSILEPIVTKDYDQLVMFANTIGYERSIGGHTWGHQFLGAVFFWIPRSIWPGKALDTGVTVGQWIGLKNVNLSSPLWSEFWLDFGPVGMVIALGALGMACAFGDRLYDRVCRDHGRFHIVSVAVPILAGYEFIVLRGSLLQAMGRLAIIAGFVLLLRLVAIRRSARADLPQPARPAPRAVR